MALAVESDRQGAGQVSQFTTEELDLLNDPNPGSTPAMRTARAKLIAEFSRRNPEFGEALEVLETARQHPDGHHVVMELGRFSLVLVADNGQPLDEEVLVPQLRQLMKGYTQLVVTRRRIPTTQVVGVAKLKRGRMNDTATPLVASVVNPVLETHEVGGHFIDVQSNAIADILTKLTFMDVGAVYATN